jgi:hypothetical protein
LCFVASGEGHEVASGHPPGLAGNLSLVGAAEQGEDPIGVLVPLLGDFTTGRDGHDDELGVATGQ